MSRIIVSCCIFVTLLGSVLFTDAKAIEGGTRLDQPNLAALLFARVPGALQPIGIGCAGTLIRPQWILTSSECTSYPSAPLVNTDYRANQIRVVLGDFTSFLFPDFDQSGAIGVTDIINHPDIGFEFDIDSGDGFFINRIALLRLQQPVVNVAPMLLYDGADLFNGSTAAEVGWDSEESGAILEDDFFQASLDVPLASVYNSENCPPTMEPFNICAGLQSLSNFVEFAERGGPLVKEIEGQQMQIGVLDFPNSGIEEEYDVHMRVSRLKSWIDSTIENFVPVLSSDICFPVKNSIICL